MAPLIPPFSAGPLWQPTRRGLVGGMGAAGLAAALPRPARAATVSGRDLKFVFVVNYGGWDPTRVFAAEFDNRSVDMEGAAGAGTVGDLTYVDHDDRPAVRSFFESHASRSVVLNGLLVPSVAHDNCLKLSMTGTNSDGAADWAAILGHDRLADFSLPHMVVAGPSFPGDAGAAVTRAGGSGQLEALLSGDIIDWSDADASAPSLRGEDLMDRYMVRRAAAAADGATFTRQSEVFGAYASALDRAVSLKDLLSVVDWDSSGGFSDQVGTAISVLSLGLSRSVTLQFSLYGWDTHSDNDYYQNLNFQSLFDGLNDLHDQLGSTPGQVGQTLADETVVVVLSEMGRTPALNSLDGKDHWPYTSALVTGPGLSGGRVIGGYDTYYYGRLIDFSSGEIDDNTGLEMSGVNLGATLLALADVDPELWHPGVPLVEGMLG